MTSGLNVIRDSKPGSFLDLKRQLNSNREQQVLIDAQHLRAGSILENEYPLASN